MSTTEETDSGCGGPEKEYLQKQTKEKRKENERSILVAFITFVCSDVKMCIKSHIWPFQTSSGKMFLLCMQNISATPSPANHSVPDPHL